MKSKNSYVIGYFIVMLGALFYFYEYFLRISPSVMKAELMHSFGMTATAFGTLSAFYFYAYSPMQLIVGILVDKFKIHRVLSAAVLCCTIGTLMMAYTSDFYVAALGRFLQGFGSAFGFIGALKLAAIWLPAERFAFFSGSCASLGFFGAAFGEILLSSMVAHFGWRHAIIYFAVSGFVLTLAFWVFLRLEPKYHTAGHKLSQKAEQDDSTLTLKHALEHLHHIIKQRYIWIAGILSSLLFLPTSVFAALWGIPYLQMLHGYSVQQAALGTSMIFIGWGLGAPVQGLISDRFRNRVKVICTGSAIAAVLSVIVLYSPSLPFWLLSVLFVLFGIFSSVQVLTFAMARDLCQPKVAGMAIAFVNTLAMVGGMVFQTGVGKILDWSWSGTMLNGERVYRIQDYEWAVSIVPICLIIAAIISLIVRERSVEKRMDESVKPQAITFNGKSHSKVPHQD